MASYSVKKISGLLGQPGATTSGPNLTPPTGSRMDPYNTGTPWNATLSGGGAMMAPPNMPPQTGVTTSPGTVPQPPPNVPRPPQTFATGNVQGVTSFGPGNSLIGAQINPTTDPRLANVQGAADQAMGKYTGFQEGQYGPLSMNTSQSDALYKELLGLARSGGSATTVGGPSLPPELTGAIGDLTRQIGSGPDRAKLAADTFDILSQRAAPGREKAVRELGQKTAALGRVGSGIYGSNLTDLQTNFDTEDALSKRQLATESAGQTLADRIQSLSALQGVSGALGSGYAGALRAAQQADSDKFNRLFDLTRDISARESDQYGRAAADRNFAAGRESELYGRRRGEYGDLLGAESQLFGQGQSARDELRGERGYQGALEADAIRRRTSQRDAEESYLDSAERRRQAEIGGLSGAFGGQPTGLQTQISQGLSAQGADAISGAGDWLSQYLLRKQMARQPQPGMARPPNVYVPPINIPDYTYNDPRFG